jgi:biotin carboxyl carrier protein
MRAELESTIAHTEERRQAAERSVFLAVDGKTPEWAFQCEDRVLLEVAQATRALADAEAVLAEARTSAAAARAAYELISASPIVAPPGSLVWSILARVGTAVDVGTPVAEWIDCDAILEGETQMRNGSVLLTRGAASILGSDDLAAIAKGHGAGLGQVIVRLEYTPEDVQDCPIGVAAWVDFPEIDVIDRLRARLRL